jgi:hypothetical protein
MCQSRSIRWPRQEKSCEDNATLKHAQRDLSNISARHLSPTTQPHGADIARAARRRIMSITACKSAGYKARLVSFAMTAGRIRYQQRRVLERKRTEWKASLRTSSVHLR